MPYVPVASCTGTPKLARAAGASEAPAASTAMAAAPARVISPTTHARSRVAPSTAPSGVSPPEARLGALASSGRTAQRIAKMRSMRVIALEEHFWTPAIAEAIGALRNPDTPRRSRRWRPTWTISASARLAAMDAAGIDLQVISHTTPGVQHLDDPETAVTLAREANDELARAVAEHPDRFAAFATLPTPDPGAAADELERAVGELGMKGAMVNGHTGGRFLDDPAFDVLLARFERLGVPLYLHPAEPVPAVRDAYYDGLQPGGLAGSSARPRGGGTPRPGCTSCAWSSAASSIAIPS